jgi:uncharacterized protein with von Willebrand factor type A (vWA) domain
VAKELKDEENKKKRLLERKQRMDKFKERMSRNRERLQKTRSERDQEIWDIRQEYGSQKQEVEQQVEISKQEITENTDAKSFVKDALKQQIKATQLIEQSSDGRFQYDDTALSHRLEDVLYEDVLDALDEGGNTGFRARIEALWDGLVNYWGELESIDELVNMDVPESLIYSKTMGYDSIQYPFIVVGKGGMIEARTSLDSATAIDFSSSMGYNDRDIIAKETGLAYNGMMRRLNPNNNSYIAIFNDWLREVSSADLIKNISPEGITRTDLALEWMLEKLAPQGIGVANLITDGEPYHHYMDVVEACIDIASRYRDFPHIYLRIFLVDGNEKTESIIRRIGEAAGPSTKVIPIKNYELKEGVFLNFADTLSDMYYIEDF